MRPASAPPRRRCCCGCLDALGVDPNYLYRDAYRANGGIRSDEEQALLESYRRLSLAGRQTVHTMVRALEGMQQELEQAQPQQAPRTIPLYFSPAAAGYAAPVFSEDYETIPVTGQVPGGPSWRCVSRATPWSLIFTTAAWCM